MKAPVIERLVIDNVTVPPGRRDIDPATIKALAESMKQIGLRTPITIHSDAEGSFVTLVAGGHRLEAAKLLGWDEIDCFVIEGDEIDAELWEISENLHRAELTVLQRDIEIARWVELTEMRVAQVGPPAGQPKEQGIRKATRELNVPRSNVQAAVKVSRLTPEARAGAKAEGLDDNQSALLVAAAAAPEAQVQAIHDIAEWRRRGCHHHTIRGSCAHPAARRRYLHLRLGLSGGGLRQHHLQSRQRHHDRLTVLLPANRCPSMTCVMTRTVSGA